MKDFKIFVPLLVLLLTSMTIMGQSVSWNTVVQKIEGDVYQITLEADIPHGYNMYDLGPYEGGPNATAFIFTPESGATLEGDVFAITKPVVAYDEIFGMSIGKYKTSALFGQKIKLSGESAKVNVLAEWMICDDTSCFPPDELDLNIEINSSITEKVKASEVGDNVQSVATPTLAVVDADSARSGGSIWAVIIEAILWGFAALLTPCVFPMVPMTVSFFMKGEKNSSQGRIQALLYGFFIVVLYTLPIAAIIIITRVVGGDAVTADIFNWLATHWIPNVIFFIVFMVFAASFFGAFEISMPSWLVNKSDDKSNSKGLTGIFFLSLTLVLVSFSCTGPIVGTVLIKSTSGEFWTPIVTMLAFSIAFALPFTIFAFFPTVLKKLPKSGGWLNSVKVVLGFLEVALGLKFLSVADQTYHWGILDREVYLAIWIVTFSLMGMYLLGKLKFSHDSEMKYLSVPRLALSILTFSFVVYLIPGMWGAPLRGMSGYLPPLHTQDYKVDNSLIGQGVGQNQSMLLTVDGEKPKYSEFLHLPHNLQGFYDLDEAEAYAKSVDKPLLVDFTGHGCVNCREMEQRVWSDPQVLNILRKDYVIVALYSDDKTTLPESEWVTTKSGRVLKGLGKINSYIARERYGVNAQPYYILQGRNDEILVKPRGYDLNVDNFVNYLRSGVDAYNNQ